MLRELDRLRGQWWWSMPAERVKVALAVLRLLADMGGEASVDLALLSTALSTSRSTLDRTLTAMSDAHLIDRLSTAGRQGGTKIRMTPVDVNSGEFDEKLKPPEITQQTLDIDTSPDLIPENFPETFSRPDLDLLQAPKNSESDLSVSSERSPTKKQNSPDSESEMHTANDLDNSQGKRPRLDPSKIAPNAWKAADGLRARILRYDPANRLAARKWEGDTGDRLAWAHQLDLMVRMDRRGWQEISDVIRWLYPDDPAQRVRTPAASMFVIHSAKSLREKFDRVRAAQQRALTEAQRTTPGRTVDNRPAPEFKRTDGSWSGNR